MFRVFQGGPGQKRWIGSLESRLYRLAAVDPEKEQDWARYTRTLLVFSALGILVTYLIQRAQHYLPINRRELAGVEPHLAFNTAVSFFACVTLVRWRCTWASASA